METAAKDSLTGKCPNCRSPYQKDKVSMSELEPDEFAEDKRKKKQPERRRGAHVNGRSRKHLQDVRILQRNLVYAVGLSLSICNEETLRQKDYFGQFGKIKKISVNRSSPYSTGQSRNGPTGAAYVTYVFEVDAATCIETVDGAIWDGRYVRACYGTTKYCAAFLKGVTCNNPDCLYMHEIVEEDTFTKEDMLSGFANGKPPFYDLIYFDRSKGPVPGSLAHKPPRGPGGTSSNGGSGQNGKSQETNASDLIKNLSSPGRAQISCRSSAEVLDWPELKRRSTSCDSTPREGTPRNGNERKSWDNCRPSLSRRSMDASWTCNRGPTQPRSPKQGKGINSHTQQETPKKTLAVLSSPIKVKMVTRPPPATKSSAPLSARLSCEAPPKGSRRDGNLSDPEEHTDIKGKVLAEQCEKSASVNSTHGAPNANEHGLLTDIGKFTVPSVSEAQGFCQPEVSGSSQLNDKPRSAQSRNVVPPTTHIEDCTYAAGEVSASGGQQAAECDPACSQLDERNSTKNGCISTENMHVFDVASDMTSACDSFLPEKRQDVYSAHTKANSTRDIPIKGGVTAGIGTSLPPPGFTKMIAKNLKGSTNPGAAKRGPPPGFENAITCGNSGQKETSIKTDTNDDKSVKHNDMRHTLHLQGATLLDGAPHASQASDAATFAIGQDYLNPMEQNMNLHQNKKFQEIIESANVAVLGRPKEALHTLQHAAEDLSMQPMASVLMGPQTQIPDEPGAPVLLCSQPTSVGISPGRACSSMLFHGQHFPQASTPGEGANGSVPIHGQHIPPGSLAGQATSSVVGQETAGSFFLPNKQFPMGRIGGQGSNASVLVHGSPFSQGSMAGIGIAQRMNSQMAQPGLMEIPNARLHDVQQMQNNLQSLEAQGNLGLPQLHPAQLYQLQGLRQEAAAMLMQPPPTQALDCSVTSQSLIGLPNIGSAGTNIPYIMGIPPIDQLTSHETMHQGGTLQHSGGHVPQETALSGLLRQLKDSPVTRQRTISTNVGTSQPGHGLVRGPLSDPAIIAAKVSGKTTPQVAESVLPSNFSAENPQQQSFHHRSLPNNAMLMHGALQHSGTHEQHVAAVMNGLHNVGGVCGPLSNSPFTVVSGEAVPSGGLHSSFSVPADNFLQGWGNADVNNTQMGSAGPMRVLSHGRNSQKGMAV